MHFLRYSFLFFALAIGSVNLNAQNTAKNEVEGEKMYTKKQLDSVYPSVIRHYIRNKHELVIAEVPALIKNAQILKDKDLEIKLRNLLGNSFIELEDFDKADKLFLNGLEVALKNKDTFAITNAYVNLGNTFFDNNPHKALDYYLQAAKYIDPSKVEEVDSFIINNNIAELYINFKNVKKAQYYLHKAFAATNSPAIGTRKEEFIAGINHNQGAIYLLQKEYDKAIAYTLKSLEFPVDKIDENYTKNNYENLMLAYEAIGDFKQLNEVRKLYDVLRDKRYENEKIRQQQLARTKFAVDTYKHELRDSKLKNDLAQQKASKKNLLILLLVLKGVILIIFISLLLYSRKKRNALFNDLKLKNEQYLEAITRSEKLAKKNARFLSTISHELRTPLYGIIGISSVLQNNKELRHASEELKSLKFSADYLLALVNDVLNINKFDSVEGKQLKKTHFITKDLMSSVVQSFEFLNTKNNNVVHLSIADNVPEILVCDKTKLSQVLMNILSNASKFTQDGAIYINLSSDKINETEHLVSFSIKDTGLGIPVEEQQKIFDEFTQVNQMGDMQGTGLGLPIVNKILNIMGSKLAFKSTPGEGTILSFNLKLHQGSKDQLEREIQMPSLHSLKGKTILIVDDNKINQVVTKKVLDQKGLSHDVADNGLIAVEKIKEQQFDAILMDINMPVMNGLDATKAIRAFNKEIPIIALTATNFEAMSDELTSCGFNDAISKPYNQDNLFKLLIKYLSHTEH